MVINLRVTRINGDSEAYEIIYTFFDETTPTKGKMNYQSLFLGLVCFVASVVSLVWGVRKPKNDESESNVMITNPHYSSGE